VWQTVTVRCPCNGLVREVSPWTPIDININIKAASGFGWSVCKLAEKRSSTLPACVVFSRANMTSSTKPEVRSVRKVANAARGTVPELTRYNHVNTHWKFAEISTYGFWDMFAESLLLRSFTDGRKIEHRLSFYRSQFSPPRRSRVSSFAPQK